MGVALATVETRHETAKASRKVRISVRVKRAIELMVDDGRKRADAAKDANLTDDALYRALTKPEVLAYRNERMRVLRESAAARTIAKAEQLMDSATSEHVQADMTKWIAGLEGIAPVQRTESITQLNVSIPGLRVMIAHREPVHLIDGQAHEVIDASDINSLPQSVPHPAMRNAAPVVENPSDPVPAKSRRRGVK